MKHIEVTVKVNETLENSIKIMQKNGFKVIRKSFIDDIYLAQNISKINK